MKFLIVDDLKEIVELVEFSLQTYYPPLQTIKAYDADSAIEIINKNPDEISLVICDLNMPDKNGMTVYSALRAKNKDTPFILLSTTQSTEIPNLKNSHDIFQISKPFSTEDLLNIVKTALSEVHLELNHVQIPAHLIPVNIHILHKLGKLTEDVFIKLSESRFIKILHAGAVFNDYELNRFENKKVDKLWVQTNGFKNLFEEYKKQIYFRETMMELDSLRLSQEMAVDHSMVTSMARNFGWNKEIIDMTTRSIENVLKMLVRTPDLKPLLTLHKKNNNSQLSTHAIELAAFCVAILDNLSWNSQLAKEKIVFAAITHDMELNDDLFETKVRMLTNVGTKIFVNTNSEIFRQIHNHPSKMAANLKLWPNCPPDIDSIILNHHEQPDGSGFPRGFKAHEIAPLSSLLILAEDVLFNCREPNAPSHLEYLNSRREFYGRGEFKNIHAAAMKALMKDSPKK
jgi:response regulator RpfG family c-di-GMP phosphodiesterase